MMNRRPFALPALLAALAGALPACDPGSGAQGTTELALSSREKFSLSENSRALVLLWGYDRTLADAGATLISRFNQSASKLPLKLDVPANPHELIDQGLGPVAQHNAKFYFNVFIDLDGDGQICMGDLVQDYDAADQQFFDYELPASVTFPVIPQADDFCRSLDSIAS